MIKTTITHYSIVLTMVVMMAGAALSVVQASEVTGTLSSNTAGSQKNDGSISGTVTNDAVAGALTGTVTSQSTQSSGGGQGSGGSIIPSTPSGAVLGATALNPAAPSFPNTGYYTPTDPEITQTFWSMVVQFLGAILSS
jgi:hypothetical protein